MNIKFFNFRPIELRITGKRVTQFYEIWRVSSKWFSADINWQPIQQTRHLSWQKGGGRKKLLKTDKFQNKFLYQTNCSSVHDNFSLYFLSASCICFWNCSFASFNFSVSASWKSWQCVKRGITLLFFILFNFEFWSIS